jgi:hypothetical protein
MTKYIASFALIFALAVYVSVQDKHPVQDSAHREWNAPRWYGFVRWPDGAATWAVLLTLLAIAEQTAIANKTLVATLRPHLIVRKIAICRGTEIPTAGKQDAHPWKFECEIANIGQGAASKIQYGFRPTVLMSLCLQKSVKSIATRCRLPCNRGKARNFQFQLMSSWFLS